MSDDAWSWIAASESASNQRLLDWLLQGSKESHPAEWTVKLEGRTKADQETWMEQLRGYCASAYGSA